MLIDVSFVLDDVNVERNDSSLDYDEKKKEKEDVIRMDDHDVIKGTNNVSTHQHPSVCLRLAQATVV